MIEQIIFVYNQQYNMYFDECSSEKIVQLGNFLTDDVGCHAIKFYKEWLNDSTRLEGGGNYSHLEKQGDKIIISFEYDWFHETPGAEVFETTISELNYILDRWQEACEKRPKKIIITKDNGKVMVDFEDW